MANLILGGTVKTRKIGSLTVSAVGLGANNFDTNFFGNRCDQDQAIRIIYAALDAGINFIDTAEEYSIVGVHGSGRSEQIIGIALGSRREEMVIGTKFLPYNPNFPDQRGAERIMQGVEDSLERLGVDHIDLLQQHQPDPHTPMEEILEALDRLQQDGKVREIGCSNFSGMMIDEAQTVSGQSGYARFVSSQSRYNLLEQPGQEGVIDACARHGMVLLPYYPLASGVLTGKYLQGQAVPAEYRLAAETPTGKRERNSLLSDERRGIVAALDSFARERGHTLLELAISWLTSQPVVASVIAGATRPEQIVANAAAANWELSADDFEAVAAITGPTRSRSFR
jgi:aryl-alcohol dehydrogenase-like predicted oxidoreductase